MRQELLDKLSALTEEERILRDNGGEIDWTVYSAAGRPRVEVGRLMEPGKLILLRPHVRVAHFPRHTHNYLEMVYMCRGTTRHVMGDGQEVILREGGLMLLNQGMTHEVFQDDPEALAVNLLILPQFFDTAFDFADGESPLARFLFSVLRSARRPAWLAYDTADSLPIRNLMESLIWSLLEGGPGRLELERATMALLFRELMAGGRTTAGDEDGGRGLVLRALQYAESEFSTASLTEFARREGVEVYTLSRRIKSATGCTFRELVQTARLVRAAALLRQTDLPVSDVAAAVGYSNLSWFYKGFALRYGMTPAQYREKMG